MSAASGGAGAGSSPRPRSSRAAHVAIGVAATVLALLHQDFWLWADRTLVLGFFPIGLLYHTIYSVVAAAFWALAMRIAWPSTVMDDGAPPPAASSPKPATTNSAGSPGAPA